MRYASSGQIVFSNHYSRYVIDTIRHTLEHLSNILHDPIFHTPVKYSGYRVQ